MTTVILSHEVSNFSSWKKGFEDGEALRAQAGVKTHGVYSAVENPNQVTIITEFPSREAVQGFLSSPQLIADMEKAGVIGTPEIKILDKV
jgi:quinol monooxygenase YgiN